ncbi:MAG: preprotein translocase subunit SecD, partial [Candidatus Altiarchaeales archaeon]
ETIERGIKKRRVISLIERIRRAFFIIFTAAATTIAVMLPLMTFVAGMLRGFAFTTIAGVLIGVFITRPAYAKIIEEILKG